MKIYILKMSLNGKRQMWQHEILSVEPDKLEPYFRGVLYAFELHAKMAGVELEWCSKCFSSSYLSHKNRKIAQKQFEDYPIPKFDVSQSPLSTDYLLSVMDMEMLAAFELACK